MLPNDLIIILIRGMSVYMKSFRGVVWVCLYRTQRNELRMMMVVEQVSGSGGLGKESLVVGC